MRRLALILALLLLAVPITATESWALPLERARASLIRLTAVEDPRVCSGSIIHKRSGFILTANHCTQGVGYGTDTSVHLLANGQAARLVKRDEDHDLAILQADTQGRPAMLRRVVPVVVGIPLAALGYGGGLSEPLATFGWVSHPHLSPWDDVPPGVVVFGNFIKGMSGGPIIDLKGRLVSVVQQRCPPDWECQDIGYGVDPFALRSFPGPEYWAAK